MVEKSAEIENTELYVFRTKGFIRWSFWTNIGLTVVISMTFMFITLGIGIPAIASTILFVGVMFGVLYMLSGKTVFTLNEDGIRQEITPNWGWHKKVIRIFPWDRINSFERGTDMNRSKQEYTFLYIQVHKPKYQLRLSDDKSSKEDFKRFADAFEEKVQSVNEQKSVSAETKRESDGIKRKASFYHRPIAKVLTLIFVVMSILLLSFAVVNGMRSFNWFRLLVVVIPGTVYMVYRVYYNKK